jgi:hypothetical protein
MSVSLAKRRPAPVVPVPPVFEILGALGALVVDTGDALLVLVPLDYGPACGARYPGAEFVCDRPPNHPGGHEDHIVDAPAVLCWPRGGRGVAA